MSNDSTLVVDTQRVELLELTDLILHFIFLVTSHADLFAHSLSGPTKQSIALAMITGAQCELQSLML